MGKRRYIFAVQLDSLCIYFSWVFKTTDSIITLNMWTLYTRQERENKNKKKEFLCCVSILRSS